MIRYIALTLLALVSTANAETINVYSGPTNALHVVANATAAKDGVNILAFAPNAASIAMRGDGTSLKTCTGDFCLFTWTKAAMVQRRCVSCELLVTATETTGKTYRVKTEVIRP